jgi:hypothetical protein
MFLCFANNFIKLCENIAITIAQGCFYTFSIFETGRVSNFSKQNTKLDTKAMRKDFFYAFLCFAKNENVILPYSNLNSKINILQNKCKVNAKLKVQNHCTKIIIKFDNSKSNKL